MNNRLAATSPLWLFGTAIALFAVLIGLRLINLDADPPVWFIPSDHGLQVDEGYKTLDPRNLSRYGTTRWNEYDEYPGWISGSPLTQWPYYFAFERFGTSIETARTVVVAGYAAFLLIALWFMTLRYGMKLAIAGLLLLGVIPALFHFSRSAIFEAPIIAVFYSCLLVWLTLVRNQTNTSVLIGAAVAGGITAAFVKASSLLYVIPAAALLVLVELISQKQLRRGLLLALPIVVVTLGTVIWTARDLWIEKLDPAQLLLFWRHFLLNPIPEIAPMLLTGTLVALLLAVRTSLNWLLESPYRLLLVGIALGSPLLLSLFKYQPPRFFVPMVPACLLLILEALRSPPVADTASIIQSARWWSTALEVLLLICLAIFGMRDLNHAILVHLPAFAGEDPGISDPTLLKLLGVVAPVLIALYYLFSRQLHKNLFRTALIASLLLALLPSSLHIHRALTQPDYRIRAISEKIETLVTPEQSVAGLIAPLFTTDNEIRPLYVNSRWLNQAEYFPQLRPDFLLLGNFARDRETLAALRSNSKLSVGDPIELGFYFVGPMQLYPLSYHETTSDINAATAQDHAH